MALNVTSDPASEATYWDVYTNGWANINCRQGCLRFWFKPDWNGARLRNRSVCLSWNSQPCTE